MPIREKTLTGWITGPQSVKKVDVILSTFKALRKQALEARFGEWAPSFHPIFSSGKFFDEEVVRLVHAIQAQKSDRLIVVDPEYLRLQEELYTNAADLGLLDPKKNAHSIYCEMLKEGSSSLDEFRSALSLIEYNGGWISDMLKSALYEIVPLKGSVGDSRTEAGFSDYNLLGSIFTGMYKGPFPVIDLAIAFVHEVGHQVLFAQQLGMVPISEESFSKKIYSGVRKTERPAIASFHAVVALVYMNEMYKKLIESYRFNSAKERIYTEQRFEQTNSSLIVGVNALSSIQLTKLGERIVEDVKATL